MSYAGLRELVVESAPHLGGNTLEGNPFAFAPAVWNYAISRFAVTSVLDLGSGLGHSADYFFRKGLRVVAVDGLAENVSKAIYPTVLIDLTQSRAVCSVDLVHCQELVEHIEEKYLDNLLSSLTCGRYVLMTHAVPGQPGHHHVNLQPSEYWIAHMERYGFACLQEDTNRIRRLARTEGASFLADTGLVFANRQRL